MWGGVLMIGAVVVHLWIHRHWLGMISRKIIAHVRGRGGRLSRGAKINIFVDTVIAFSFLCCVISGVYFLFAPTGGFQAGRNAGWDPGILFSRTTWDLIHTWPGAALIIAAITHLYIHWGWLTKVTGKLVRQAPRVASRSTTPIRTT